jgi:hypothetical protein
MHIRRARIRIYTHATEEAHIETSQKSIFLTGASSRRQYSNGLWLYSGCYFSHEPTCAPLRFDMSCLIVRRRIEAKTVFQWRSGSVDEHEILGSRTSPFLLFLALICDVLLSTGVSSRRQYSNGE